MAKAIRKRKIRSNRKYDPSFCDIVIEVAEKGGWHAAMYRKLGITKKTFQQYRKDIPEFAIAVEEADLILQESLEKTLLGLAKAECKGNLAAIQFLLQVKFRDEYRLSTDVKSESTNITINQLNLTPEQRDYKIAQLTEKLRAQGIDLSSLTSPKLIEGSHD